MTEPYWGDVSKIPDPKKPCLKIMKYIYKIDINANQLLSIYKGREPISEENLAFLSIFVKQNNVNKQMKRQIEEGWILYHNMWSMNEGS